MSNLHKVSSIQNRKNRPTNIFRTNFTQVPNNIIRNPKITPYAKTVYLVLISFSPSFPSYKRIMELTGITSRTTISNCLRILVSIGVLKVIHNPNYKSNLYEFCEMDPTSTITGLELVHEVDTNKTNIIIPNNNINGSTAPPKGDAEPLVAKEFLKDAYSSLGNIGKYGYIEKPRPTFIVDTSAKST